VKLVGKHQVEGCNWMLDKEILPVSDGLPRGGILADEVGLGKTYMAAGVIRANPVPLTLIVTLVNVKMQWCTILRHFANRMANQIPDYFHPENLNPAYFRQMHEDARTRGQKVLATSSSDDESVIIISTYTQMRTRPKWATDVVWDRIILDEGHYIRNPRTTSFSSLFALRSRVRWILTATPIHNGVRDLITLFEWLKLDVSPLLAKEKKTNKTTNTEAGDEEEEEEVPTRLLHDMTSRYVLRRTLASEQSRTDQLKLLPVTEHVMLLEWDNAFERDLYGRVHAVLVRGVAELKSDAGNGKTKKNAAIQAIMRLRQISVSFEIYKMSLDNADAVSRMRIKDREEIRMCPGSDKIEEDYAFYQRAITTLYEGEEADTYSVVERPSKKRPYPDDVTAAGVPLRCLALDFGRDMATYIEEQGRKDAEDEEDADGREDRAYERDISRTNSIDIEPIEVFRQVCSAHERPTSSTKLRKLWEMLNDDFAKRPTAKTIIFTTFIEEMKIIYERLRESGIQCVRLYGGMNTQERSEVIDTFMDFDKKPFVNVLVAQIMCSSTGINLQCADTVYITSPTWNPCIETQAIGRVHRQGQTRPVSVFRLAMKGSIEEKCLDIQDKKRGVINEKLPEPDVSPPLSLPNIPLNEVAAEEEDIYSHLLSPRLDDMLISSVDSPTKGGGVDDSVSPPSPPDADDLYGLFDDG